MKWPFLVFLLNQFIHQRYVRIIVHAKATFKPVKVMECRIASNLTIFFRITQHFLKQQILQCMLMVQYRHCGLFLCFILLRMSLYSQLARNCVIFSIM